MSNYPLRLLTYIAARTKRVRAAVKNYSLAKPGTFANVQGYGHSENMMLHTSEAADEYADNLGRSTVTGTLQMILDRLWELKGMYSPQAFFPHVYFSGRPRDEARKNMHLFAETVSPQVQNWSADVFIDDRFLDAAA